MKITIKDLGKNAKATVKAHCANFEIKGTIYDVTEDGSKVWVETTEDIYVVDADQVIITDIEMVCEFKNTKQLNDYFKCKEAESVKACVWDDQDGAYIEVYAELEDGTFETIAYSKNGDANYLQSKLKATVKKYANWIEKAYNIPCSLEIATKIKTV